MNIKNIRKDIATQPITLSLRRLQFAVLFATVFCLMQIARLPEVLSQTKEDCLNCHNDKTLEGEGGRKLFVDPEGYANTVHGKNSVDCINCHVDLAGVKDFPHKSPLAPPNCATCHDKEDAKYRMSIHGKVHLAGNRDAPSCATCHGSHYIKPMSDPSSEINPLNIPKICDRCHANADIAKRNGLPDPSFIRSYDTGVHGKALKNSGLIGAAMCVSCHGSHEILKASDGESRVNRKQIPKTCGVCHAGIYQDYILSVHGLDYLKGMKDAPVCTDCHGEHDILDHTDPKSDVFTTRVGATCSRCHDNAELIRRFNLPPDRLRSYEGTYHGIASMGGNLKVANCASCHGVHNILPSSNPSSLVNPRNLPSTCGKPQCHGRNLQNVIKGKVHIIESKRDNIWVYIVTNVYKVMITLVIGGFLAFIAVDLYARFRRHRAVKSSSGRSLGNG